MRDARNTSLTQLAFPVKLHGIRPTPPVAHIVTELRKLLWQYRGQFVTLEDADGDFFTYSIEITIRHTGNRADLKKDDG